MITSYIYLKLQSVPISQTFKVNNNPTLIWVLEIGSKITMFSECAINLRYWKPTNHKTAWLMPLLWSQCDINLNTSLLPWWTTSFPMFKWSKSSGEITFLLEDLRNQDSIVCIIYVVWNIRYIFPYFD